MKSQETKKKILYVVTQGEWGGAQRYVFDLATGFGDEFDFTIAIGESRRRRELQEKLELWNMENGTWNNIKIIELRHLVRKISFFHDILAVFELTRLYRKLKPDIVHLNSSKAGIIGSFAKLLNAPCSMLMIYTVHGWVFNEPLGYFKKNFYRLLEKITAKLKDKIIVLSENDFQSGLKIGIKKEKLVKIPLGIKQTKSLDREIVRKKIAKLFQPQVVQPLTENGHIVENFTWIGTIANLYPTKGLTILIDAVKKLKELKNIENIRFIIIGEGEERKKLQSLIRTNNLQENIFLPGTIENAPNYLPAFDLFILPSLKEGLPYTIMEAMGAGVPIITTNVGGIPSLIDNTNGLLINPADAEQLADSIMRAMENPNEMKKRAERALKKINKFSLENMLSETNDAYTSS